MVHRLGREPFPLLLLVEERFDAPPRHLGLRSSPRRCLRMVDSLRSCDGFPCESVSIHQVRSSRTMPPSRARSCSSPIRWRQARSSSSIADRLASVFVRACVGVSCPWPLSRIACRAQFPVLSRSGARRNLLLIPLRIGPWSRSRSTARRCGRVPDCEHRPEPLRETDLELRVRRAVNQSHATLAGFSLPSRDHYAWWTDRVESACPTGVSQVSSILGPTIRICSSSGMEHSWQSRA